MISNVKKYFTELIQTPSVSGKETAILTYIKKHLAKLNIEYSLDEDYGLIARIPATKEKFPTIFSVVMWIRIQMRQRQFFKWSKMYLRQRKALL